MKKIVLTTFVLFLLFSCGGDKTYYETFNKTKTITERVSDLNKNIDEIRKIEKGKITREDIDYLEYEYPIGEGDSYVVSYLFDQKGSYEIGIDGYFATQENATQFLHSFKAELTKTYGEPKEGNQLARWLSKNEAVTIEIDFADTDKGMAVVTIFANQ